MQSLRKGGHSSIPRVLVADAGLAVILAAVGIFGVICYSIAQRTHEIGIRVAVGAGRRDVLRLVLEQGTILALLGLAAGLEPERGA